MKFTKSGLEIIGDRKFYSNYKAVFLLRVFIPANERPSPYMYNHITIKNDLNKTGTLTILSVLRPPIYSASEWIKIVRAQSRFHASCAKKLSVVETCLRTYRAYTCV